MSKFGWSLHPWRYHATGEDEPDYAWEMQAHCTHCGAWLPLKPDRTEPWEIRGDEDWIIMAGTYHIWGCRKCGQETRQVDW